MSPAFFLYLQNFNTAMICYNIFFLSCCFLLLFVSTSDSLPTKYAAYNRGNSTVIGGVVNGVDVSSLIYPTAFKCLKEAGYDFVIIRAYQSTCRPDSNAIHTIANAREGGIKYIDVYMFPSPTCHKSASEQVEEMVQSLSGESYGQIWLDIEGSQYWLGSETSNRNFFEELLSAAMKYKQVGIYSSSYQWSSIMGSSYTGGSNHQLWYAHYDNNPSFSDFEPFGGWSKPGIKQYAGDKIVCGVDVDKDWY